MKLIWFYVGAFLRLVIGDKADSSYNINSDPSWANLACPTVRTFKDNAILDIFETIMDNNDSGFRNPYDTKSNSDFENYSASSSRFIGTSATMATCALKKR